MDYQRHIKRLPFWIRKPAEELSNVIYKKEGKELFAVGINQNGYIIHRPILYAHFYKRKLSTKTCNMSNYIIRPNTFIDNFRISKATLFYHSNHPSTYYQKLLRKIKNYINRYFHLRAK